MIFWHLTSASLLSLSLVTLLSNVSIAKVKATRSSAQWKQCKTLMENRFKFMTKIRDRLTSKSATKLRHIFIKKHTWFLATSLSVINTVNPKVQLRLDALKQGILLRSISLIEVFLAKLKMKTQLQLSSRTNLVMSVTKSKENTLSSFELKTLKPVKNGSFSMLHSSLTTTKKCLAWIYSLYKWMCFLINWKPNSHQVTSD